MTYRTMIYACLCLYVNTVMILFTCITLYPTHYTVFDYGEDDDDDDDDDEDDNNDNRSSRFEYEK